MNKPVRVFLLFASVLLSCTNCLARPKKQPLEQGLRLGVRLYNYVRVPDEQVTAAEEVVSQILNQARIELEWTACIVTRGASGSVTSPCNASARSSDVVVYLVGALQDHVSWIDFKALGYSIIPDAGAHEPATMAYVSYPQVQRLSAWTSADVVRVLGLAVAHEIGHLLLGSRDHANQGIMRGTWKLKDLENRAWEEFKFTRDQARRLHSSVQARLLIDKRIMNVQQKRPEREGTEPEMREANRFSMPSSSSAEPRQ